MSKTPYQIMREQQKEVIEAQQAAVHNRIQAHKQGIEFKSQADLNEKLEAQNRETLRLAKIRREEEEARIAENRRKAEEDSRRRRELQVNQQYANRASTLDDYDYTRKSSGSSSSSTSSSSSDSYSSCSGSSSSSSDSSSSCSSSSSSSCD